MKTFQSLIPAFGLFALAKAHYYANASSEAIAYTTITTDIFTTVCPSPTEVTQGSKTYTVTAPTTLTITDCPCTIRKPLATVPVPVPVPMSSHVPSPHENITIPFWTTTTVSTYVTVCPTPATFTVGSSTYTVTESTVLTITNCPCTISYSATPITTTAKTTVSIVTTYCPTPTAITVGGTTYTAFTPGYVTIPIVSVTTYVIPAPVPTAPITLSPAGTLAGTPATVYTTAVIVSSSAKATSSGLAQVTFNAANNLHGGMGAVVAVGLAALLL